MIRLFTYLVFSSLMVFGSVVNAQSIINPDFETFSSCPTAQSQLIRATGWTQPTTFGSTDYMNVCTPLSGTSFTLAPLVLTAQNGSGFAGAFMELNYNNGSTTRYKEYLTNKLSAPLVAGVIYRFSFYVAHLHGTTSPAKFAPSDISYVDLPSAEQGFLGAVFSTVSPTNSNIEAAPPGNAASIVNSFGSGRTLIPASNTSVYGSASRNAWVKVILEYTAVGGEEYMTVGQFRPGATVLTDKQAVYYLFDNFSASLTPPTILSKSVSPATIPSGGTATYTFTLNNINAASITLTNLSFTDNLPSGLRLATNPNVTVTGLTGGTINAVSGGTSIVVSGYSQAANTTATITVDVTNIPGQGNTDCASNPVAFTNKAVNITEISDNIRNNVGNVCLKVSPVPFACDSKMYLFQNLNTGLYDIDTSTNPFTYPIIGSPAGYQCNAAAYNPNDGYIYAIRTFTNDLLRIDASGTFTNLGAISGLPAASGTTNYNSGEIDDLGNYYIKHAGSNNILYKVNIASKTATSLILTQSVDPSDLAYSVIDDLLYGVAGDGRMFSINLNNGTVSFIGISPGPAVFGGMIGTNTGEIYGINNSGGFYQFNPINGNRIKISDAPASGNNDGVHCATASIAFSADLSVTKTDNSFTYAPGSNRVYTVVVRNDGPFGVLDASVTDNVPVGVPNVNVSYTAVASAGSTTTVTGTQIGAINDLVSLAVNGTVTYTVTVSVPATFTGDLINTVTVTPPSNIIDNDLNNNQATDINTNGCTEPGMFDQQGQPSLTGISDLAGFTGGTTGWPANVPNGHVVIESKNKGFVITRVSSSAAITSPVEGMLIYDIAASCVKLYNGIIWKCLEKDCNPLTN